METDTMLRQNDAGRSARPFLARRGRVDPPQMSDERARFVLSFQMILATFRKNREAVGSLCGPPGGQRGTLPALHRPGSLLHMLLHGLLQIPDAADQLARQGLEAGRGGKILVDHPLGLRVEGLPSALEGDEQVRVIERWKRKGGDDPLDSLEQEPQSLDGPQPSQPLARLLVLDVVRGFSLHLVLGSSLEIHTVGRTGDLDDPLLSAADRADAASQGGTGSLPLARAAERAGGHEALL